MTVRANEFELFIGQCPTTVGLIILTVMAGTSTL